MFHSHFSALVVCIFLTLSAPVAHACSATTLCTVENGSYFVALPDNPTSDTPVILFIHGFGSNGGAVIKNRLVTEQFLARGFAVAAPNGMKLEGRNGRSWSFHPKRPQRRDEIAFLTSVRDNVVARNNLNPDKTLLSGFSIGGSMSSYLACEMPRAFFAYAPVGGSFWRPHPTECNGPVRLFHTHGWRDGTVPLEGRALGGKSINDTNAIAQGDVFRALGIFRETNGCLFGKADSFETTDDVWRRKWERCTPGSALEFALHPRGHVIPKEWANMVVDWFEKL